MMHIMHVRVSTSNADQDINGQTVSILAMFEYVNIPYNWYHGGTDNRCLHLDNYSTNAVKDTERDTLIILERDTFRYSTRVY